MRLATRSNNSCLEILVWQKRKGLIAGGANALDILIIFVRVLVRLLDKNQLPFPTNLVFGTESYDIT